MSSIGLPDPSGVGAPLPTPTGQSPCAAVPVSNARAEASRRNGAKSRGPKSARRQGPDRRGMPSSTACARSSISCCRTRTAPSSPGSRRRWSQTSCRSARCRRCWPGGSRSPRGVSRGPTASRPSCSRSGAVADGGLGLALIRDGNGARSFETLLRYRGAAMAEFGARCARKALKAHQALQAEQSLEADTALAAPSLRPAARPPLASSSATERTRAPLRVRA